MGFLSFLFKENKVAIPELTDLQKLQIIRDDIRSLGHLDKDDKIALDDIPSIYIKAFGHRWETRKIQSLVNEIRDVIQSQGLNVKSEDNFKNSIQYGIDILQHLQSATTNDDLMQFMFNVSELYRVTRNIKTNQMSHGYGNKVVSAGAMVAFNWKKIMIVVFVLLLIFLLIAFVLHIFSESYPLIIIASACSVLAVVIDHMQ